MTKYFMYHIKISRLISDKILLSKKKTRLKLVFKNNIKNLILKFQNMFYFPNSLYNLLNLSFFNNNSIYYNNKKNF